MIRSAALGVSAVLAAQGCEQETPQLLRDGGGIQAVGTSAPVRNRRRRNVDVEREACVTAEGCSRQVVPCLVITGPTATMLELQL